MHCCLRSFTWHPWYVASKFSDCDCALNDSSLLPQSSVPEIVKCFCIISWQSPKSSRRCLCQDSLDLSGALFPFVRRSLAEAEIFQNQAQSRSDFSTSGEQHRCARVVLRSFTAGAPVDRSQLGKSHDRRSMFQQHANYLISRYESCIEKANCC